MKILYESKDKELKYVKKKYDLLVKRYNDIEWKYQELLLSSHYSRESYNKLERKYNNLLKNNIHADTTNLYDIQSINEEYEHI
jgi:calcineurin-like phosphoesterase family protein